MGNIRVLSLVLFCGLITTGCGNFWMPPGGTTGSNTGGSGGSGSGGGSSGGGTTSNASSGIVYVINQATKQIVGYSVTSGKFASVANSLSSLSAPPYALSISSDGSLLYVSTSNGIYLYNVGPNGELTAGNGADVIAKDPAAAMQIDATGSWLLDAYPSPNGVELNAIPINSTTGLLAGGEQTIQISGSVVNQLAITPDDQNILIALGGNGTDLVPFTSNSNTPFGSLINIPVKNTSGSAASVAVDPMTRVFYVGEAAALSGTANTGGLRVFDYSTLSEISGSPYPTGGMMPSFVLPETNGNYVYVANKSVSGASNGNVAGFNVNTAGSSYSLSAFSTNPVSTGVAPTGLAEDSTASYVLIADSGGNPDLEAYALDTSTGGLSTPITSATGTDPTQSIAIIAAP